MIKGYKKSPTGKETSMASKHMGRWSVSVLIRDIKLNNNEKPFHALQTAKLKE